MKVFMNYVTLNAGWEFIHEMDCPPTIGDVVRVGLECGCDQSHMLRVTEREFILDSETDGWAKGCPVAISLDWEWALVEKGGLSDDCEAVPSDVRMRV